MPLKVPEAKALAQNETVDMDVEIKLENLQSLGNHQLMLLYELSNGK